MSMPRERISLNHGHTMIDHPRLAAQVLLRIQQPLEEQSHHCQPGHLIHHYISDGKPLYSTIPQMKSSLSVCWALSRYLSVFRGIACRWEK